MTIPASEIVNVNPLVLNAAGNAPVLSGVFLTQNTLVPAGTVLNFPSAEAVGQYFGLSSQEYDLANRVYFEGYTNATLRPGNLIIAPYNLAARSALLKSSYLQLTLTELQALSGQFSIIVNGVIKETNTINLSTATSFSDAATILEAAIGDVTVTWNGAINSFIIETTTTGTTATLSYAVDVIPSTLAESLGLTQSAGAALGNGAAADTPTTAINNLTTNTTAWFGFTTLWEPIQTDKLLFASAINTLNNKNCYVCWDTDDAAIVPNSITCTAFKINQIQYNGTFMISGDKNDILNEGSTIAKATLDVAVFVLGFVASIDFSQTNGRTTAAFRSLNGLVPTVTNKISAENLLGNKYNFYGNYANATNDWIFLYPGNISGIFKWLDSLYGAVYLDAQMQTQEMELLTNLNLIPYNDEGFTSIKLALNGPINDAINFGTIQKGVTLSDTQKAAVTAQAGRDISQVLFTNGWYLQVLPPSDADRQARKTPIINFWYTDGQSIQQITINSVDIL